MRGSVLQVNVSPGGLPKRPVRQALVTPLGVEGDVQAHPEIHGGPAKAVLLIPAEATDALIERGFPLFYGALGENVTTRGIDIRALMPLMRIRCGAAVLETTTLRRPCSQLDVYGRELRGAIEGDPPLGGWYARVLTPGLVKPGDPVEILDVSV